jgi:transposase-like protein
MLRPNSKLSQALEMVLLEGSTIEKAAKATGYKPHMVSKAIEKAGETGQGADVLRAWIAAGSARTRQEILRLATSAKSEDVRLRAARTWQEMHGDLKPDKSTASGQGQTLIQINIGSRGDAAKPREIRPGVVQGAEPMPIIIDA